MSKISLIIILLFLYSSCITTQKQVIVVPEGVDNFVIVYECECGIEIEQKNGVSKFEIPSNGILLVKNEWRNKVINTDIYQRLANGSEVLLQSI